MWVERRTICQSDVQSKFHSMCPFQQKTHEPRKNPSIQSVMSNAPCWCCDSQAKYCFTHPILLIDWYGWWKKSCTSWYMVNIPLFTKVLYIPGGAGSLPSTVVIQNNGLLNNPRKKWGCFSLITQGTTREQPFFLCSNKFPIRSHPPTLVPIPTWPIFKAACRLRPAGWLLHQNVGRVGNCEVTRVYTVYT